MARLWEHRVSLHVGTSTIAFDGIDVLPDTLRIIFDGEKTASPEPNNVYVQVYNLSKESIKRIGQYEGMIATVRGAYLDNCSFFGEQYNIGAIPIIFRFDVSRVETDKNLNGDIVTMIEGAEGQIAYYNAYMNKAIAPNTSMEDIFKSVLGLIPYAANEGTTFVGTQKDATGKSVDRGTSIDPAVMDYITTKIGSAKSTRLSKATAIYSVKEIHGVTMHGFTRDILSNICERHDLTWFNDAGTIYVVGIDDSLDVDILEVTPSNGLIGLPKKLESGVIEWNMKIRPEIKPWTNHEIKNVTVDPDLNGTYKIGKIDITGDTHGAAWDMRIAGAVL